MKKSTLTLFLFAWFPIVFLMACGAEPTVESTQEPVAATAVPTVLPATIVPSAYPAPTQELSDSYPAPPTAVAQLHAYPEPENNSHPPVYSYRIINSYPHDTGAFTQGLLWHDGVLYESTGRVKTPTSLRRVNLEDGAVLQKVEQSDEYFGEGLVLWADELIQLTWQNGVAFVYDKETFEQMGQFSYETEGWGLTHDGRQLIMSDGTNTLYFRDPETFAEIGQVQVFDGEQPVIRLNELEFIEGEVWANVWQTNRIARIDPETGQVVSWVDLTGLLETSNLTEPVDVLNGIAYDPENGRLFITGKLWPTLFEIEIVEQ